MAFVHRGVILSDDATRTIHECATMLGLPLETELPNNVLLITSLRKSNSLEDGRFYLRETFNEFGQIETAALAPRNHGFGEITSSSLASLLSFIYFFYSFLDLFQQGSLGSTVRSRCNEQCGHFVSLILRCKILLSC